MSLNLISVGELDKNDYESYLVDRGYTDLEPALKKDIIAVLTFFCNEDLVLNGLKQFAQQYFQFNSQNKKSLRDFFNDWGSKNHFNQNLDSELPAGYQISDNFSYPYHTPILFGELSSDLFLNVLLKKGYLSSDSGAGPEHGKWSHTIQAFILEEARKENKLTLYSATVCEFIQKISQVKPFYSSFSLWDILFDSFEDNIFTCPNNIVAELGRTFNTTEAERFLSSKLLAHKEKVLKLEEKNGYGAYSQEKYLSRLSEASYIRSTKYGMLWLKPRRRYEHNDTGDDENLAKEVYGI